MKPKISSWKTVASIFLFFILVLSSVPLTVSAVSITNSTGNQMETQSINNSIPITEIFEASDNETYLDGIYAEVFTDPIYENATYEEKLKLACFPEQSATLNLSENAVYYDNGDIYDPPNLTCASGDDDPVVYVCLLVDDDMKSHL